MQYDKDFLLALDKERNKIIYARIIKLTFDEKPIEMIQGKATGGSINIDGASALRRTCSLSLLASDNSQIDFYCGLHTKFKLEIGVKNNINSKYPDIIWFNQGVYVTTSFSSSRSPNSFTVSISGKDKMCLLNGDIGGTLESNVDFGQIEEEDVYGSWVIKKIPIKDIIKNAVHVYGKEPYHNIIINDLEDYGIELLEYRYDVPLYLYQELNENVYENAFFSESSNKYEYKNGNSWTGNFTLDEMPEDCFKSLGNLADVNNGKPIRLKGSTGNGYYFTKIQYGETCGYRVTDLTYAGDLIAKAGESLVSVLDKIKNMLVEFEYFYNLDGQFVFQKKLSTISIMQNLNPEETNQFDSSILFNDNIYNFTNNETLTSINNNPNLLNLRNDYSIWGERATASGTAIPIHMRYAIDTKPIEYTTIEVSQSEVADYANKHNIAMSGQSSITYRAGTYWHLDGDVQYCDWREIIYRMAADYYKYNFLENFYQKIVDANGELYLNGVTGYENYYIDIYSLWRQLYYPIAEEKTRLSATQTAIENEISSKENEKTTKNNSLKNDSLTVEEKSNLEIEINEIEAVLTYLQEKRESTILRIENLEKDSENYYLKEESSTKCCWNKFVFTQSYNLNFWFDFLEYKGVLSQYNIQKIGSRPKVINENNLKSITYNKIPNVIYCKNQAEVSHKSGYAYINIGTHFDNMFTISSQGKSLQDKLNELINIHSFCIESATINAIPVYYLEPNSRILLTDKKTGLNDVYAVSKISIPLVYNGTMSITANKIYETII